MKRSNESLKNGYRKHSYKFFSYVKTINVEGIAYDVDVDFLAGIYGGSNPEKRSQHIQGLKALKATGGNFAFSFPANNVKIEAPRADGAIDTANISLIGIVPFLVMKTAALGRGKPKDAYDIYFVIKHYEGGVIALGKTFETVKHTNTIKGMKTKLSEKFSSINHSGPMDVANFLDPDSEEEFAFLKRDAYEQIQALISTL